MFKHLGKEALRKILKKQQMEKTHHRKSGINEMKVKIKIISLDR